MTLLWFFGWKHAPTLFKIIEYSQIKTNLFLLNVYASASVIWKHEVKSGQTIEIALVKWVTDFVLRFVLLPNNKKKTIWSKDDTKSYLI